MVYPIVWFEKQALTAEVTNPLTSPQCSLSHALTASHSCYLNEPIPLTPLLYV